MYSLVILYSQHRSYSSDDVQYIKYEIWKNIESHLWTTHIFIIIMFLTCEVYLTSVLLPQATCWQNNSMVWVTNPQREPNRPRRDSGRNESKRQPTVSFNNSGGNCNSVMGTGSSVTAGPQPNTFHFLLDSTRCGLVSISGNMTTTQIREPTRSPEGGGSRFDSLTSVMPGGSRCHKQGFLAGSAITFIWVRRNESFTHWIITRNVSSNHMSRFQTKQLRTRRGIHHFGSQKQLYGFINYFARNVGVHEQHEWLHFSTAVIHNLWWGQHVIYWGDTCAFIPLSWSYCLEKGSKNSVSPVLHLYCKGQHFQIVSWC